MMQKLNFARMGIVILLLSIIPGILNAQLHNALNQLDTSYISTNFLYPNAFKLFKVPDPYGNDDTLTSGVSSNLFMRFGISVKVF